MNDQRIPEVGEVWTGYSGSPMATITKVCVSSKEIRIFYDKQFVGTGGGLVPQGLPLTDFLDLYQLPTSPAARIPVAGEVWTHVSNRNITARVIEASPSRVAFDGSMVGLVAETLSWFTEQYSPPRPAWMDPRPITGQYMVVRPDGELGGVAFPNTGFQRGMAYVEVLVTPIGEVKTR